MFTIAFRPEMFQDMKLGKFYGGMYIWRNFHNFHILSSLLLINILKPFLRMMIF